MWNRVPTRRLVRYASGVVLTYVGFALAVRSRMGLGPLNVLQHGVARVSGISLGAAGLIVGVTIVVAATACGRPPAIGTAMSVVGGALVLDGSLALIPEPAAYAARLSSIFVALLLMALGGAVCISAHVGLSPTDSLMIGITELLPRLSLRTVRLMIEAVALALGAALGGKTGIGTVIIGAGIGPGIQYGLKLVRHNSAGRPLVINQDSD
jgi:uncharacterized membrane protein YczE